LLEGIIAASEDERLMERYLAGERLDEQVLLDDLETAVARNSLHPAIPVCAATQLGLDLLLDLIVRGFPAPVERPLPLVTSVDGGTREPLMADPDGPLIGLPSRPLVRWHCETQRPAAPWRYWDRWTT